MSVPVRVENLVATTRLAAKVPLEDAAHRFQDAEYHPDKLDALIFKDTGSTVLVFSDGQATVTGPRSERDLRDRVDAIRLALGDVGIEVAAQGDVKIENVVASVQLDTELPLDQCALALEAERVGFLPEVFPGLVYRTVEPEATIFAFASGKIVVTECADLGVARELLNGFVAELASRGLVDAPEAEAA